VQDKRSGALLVLNKIKINLMSYLYTLETADKMKNQDNLTDIVDPILVIDDTLNYYPYIVSEEEAMRIDLICYSIYGNFAYIDELLTINNILNPWSIKGGSIIYFLDEDDLNGLKVQPKTDQEEIINELVNPNKDTKKDPNRDTGIGLPPTIKPSNLKDVDIDYDNKTIKIIDRFK